MLRKLVALAVLSGGLFTTAARAEPVPNHYIVVLKEPAALVESLGLPLSTPVVRLLDRVQSELGIAAQQITYRYDSAFKGFAVQLPEHVAKALAGHGLVAYVEQDQYVKVNFATQENATWGLDRIDSVANTRDMRYTYSTTAPSVHAYVVDSGIRATHREFTGRVGNGFDALAATGGGGGLLGGGLLGGGLLGGGGLFGGLFGAPSQQPAPAPSSPNNPLDPSTNPADCNGHGTHVAGTIGGTQFGVAKEVILHGVRVVNCQGVGTSASTAAGVDWVIRNHVKPAVMNLSLGGGASTAVDQAVRAADAAGIVTVVAAGNENRDACGFSPARERSAITVASTDAADRRSSFSNFGPCVDIFAPGSSITSAGIRNDNDQAVLSGTSMASPHVAGAAAKLLAQGVAPANVATVLANQATRDLVGNSSNTLNLLLFSR